jgi:putative transposase
MTTHGSFIYNKATRHNIAGHVHFYTFSCYKRLPLLTNTLWREWLAQSIRHAQTELRFELWAYVFMPEHVHLLLRPLRETYRFSAFMQLAKNPVARRIITSLKKCDSPLLKELRVIRNDGAVEYRFWQPGGGHDLNIWNMKKAVEKAEYCHNNPVKRGLVNNARDWRWSSFRWLVENARNDEPLTVDDWTEGIRADS